MVLPTNSKPGLAIPRWVFSVLAILIVAWWLSTQPQPPGERGAAPTPEQNAAFEPSIPVSTEPDATTENRVDLPKVEARTEKTPQIEPIVEKVPPRSTKTAERKPNPKPTAPDTKKRDVDPLVISNVTIKDQSGRTVFKGDVDLHATFDRIERGEKFPHRNDGSTFRNLERRLPQKPAGYYTEYVHPTPPLNGPGPQRIVIGKNGEAFYTHDHYGSFRKVRE